MSQDEGKASAGTERGVIEFLAATENLRWNAESFDASLRTLFKAVNQLAKIDFEYYQRRAKIQSRISYWLRVFGAIFGTLGVISPALLAT